MLQKIISYFEKEFTAKRLLALVFVLIVLRILVLLIISITFFKITGYFPFEQLINKML